MSAQPVPDDTKSLMASPETANEKLKKGWENWFWGGMMGAIAIHFAIFALFPNLNAEDVSFDGEELEAIDSARGRDPAAAGGDSASGDPADRRGEHRRGHHDRTDDLRG